ncbi:ComEC family competence protein [Neorhizobium lilium]|uniref:ComEC family competence protein n=1 Tax=Neorhizobium lilium TaxID=2503024 RepID=A0A3S3S372_9HYPH|nr:ComEC/Rec2 family competence protein [Neorhizobium lilium]RWX75595.1 ComEC family competence protein [Neorhizobium lilium]
MDLRLARIARQVPALLAQEAAYGHAFLFVPVLIGAGAITWFSLPQDPAFWPLLVAFLIFSGVAMVVRHGTGSLRLLPCGLALFVGGMLLADTETRRLDTTILDTPVTTNVTGVVERRESDAQGRWRYIVRLQKTTKPELSRAPQRVSLLARGRHDPAALGDTIAGRVRISPPSGPALPGLNDFAFSSYFDGVGAVGFFYGAPELLPQQADSAQAWDSIESRLFDLRSTIGDRIRATVAGDAGAFAAAIVTDERRAISQETTEALRLAGLAHIIAISGLNMALAAGIFFVGVRTVLSLFPGFAQTYSIKKIAAFGALVMVTAYYMISGFGVSAERAYIMMAVILVAVLFDRQSLSLRNVALSALIIIAISPSEILGPSFQMSFAATAALIAGYEAWQRRRITPEAGPQKTSHRMVTSVSKAGRFVAGIIMTSLIGSVSTAMFSVEHFHRIATYGLAANLAAMPLISFIVMPAGLVAMLFMPFGLDAPFLKLMAMGLEGVIEIARYVAAWGGDVGVGRQHAWFLGLAGLGFVLLTLLRTRLRLIGLPFIAVALFLSWQAGRLSQPDILVSEDGTTVALLGPDGVATNRNRVPGFIYDQWRRALLLGDPVKPDMLPRGAEPTKRDGRFIELTGPEIEAARAGMREAPGNRFLCTSRAWCAARSGKGALIVAVEDGRYAGVACDVADIVIAPRARFDNCRSGALMFNGDILRKTGALEIALNNTADMEAWRIHTAMVGKDRGWNRHRHYNWRGRSFDTILPEPLQQIISDSGG